jgi:hypothetical protein
MDSRRDKDEPVNVFLSYASEDREQVRVLRKYLARYMNARVFSQESLSAGEDWREKLRDEIVNSNIIVALLSSNSSSSSWMRQELGAAWALEKPVLSVCTEPYLSAELPVEFKRIEHVNLKDMENPKEFKHRVKMLLNFSDEKRKVKEQKVRKAQTRLNRRRAK